MGERVREERGGGKRERYIYIRKVFLFNCLLDTAVAMRKQTSAKINELNERD